MGSLALLGIVAVTSLGAYLVVRGRLGLRRGALPAAVGDTLECVGLAVIFLASNLAVGLLLVFGLRALSGRFVSVYGLNDITLVVLSFLQAFFVHSWRRSR